MLLDEPVNSLQDLCFNLKIGLMSIAEERDLNIRIDSIEYAESFHPLF